jgi:two-component system OmpR family response regulator
MGTAPAANTVTLKDGDVITLTGAGEKEIGGSATSLSRLELELLVLVDGVATVAQLTARAKNTAAMAVASALRSLMTKKMITIEETLRTADSIDVGDFFKTSAFFVPQKPSAEHDREAADGTSSLQREGYYVRIAKRAASERKAPAGGKLTVTIIEDEPHLAKLLRSFLSIEGFETRVAGNRAEIVEALRKAPPPDLVLLDVVLPDADGFEILGKLRHHPAFQGAAIVMLTGKATREAVLTGLAGGADGYITKPFEMDVLMKAVQAVLGQPAA